MPCNHPIIKLNTQEIDGTLSHWWACEFCHMLFIPQLANKRAASDSGTPWFPLTRAADLDERYTAMELFCGCIIRKPSQPDGVNYLLPCKAHGRIGSGTPTTPSEPSAEAFWDDWSCTDAGHTAIMRDACSEMRNFAYLPRLFAEAYVAPLRQQLQAAQQSISDYEEVLSDHQRLVRELDIAMNGEEGAAQQASLVDLIGPAEDMRAELASLKAAGEGWIPCTERMPEVGQFVDVVIGDIVQVQPAKLSGDGFWDWVDANADEAPQHVVSHWRKRPTFTLPAPAKPAEGTAAKEGK